MEMYRDYNSAETIINDKMLEVETLLLRTEEQLNFLRDVWDTLSERHRLLQTRQLYVLQSRLHDCLVTFEGISGKTGKLTKFKFAISVKDHLTQTIDELTKWQSLFDPSYFLIGLISTSLIDYNLKTALAGKDETGPLSRMKELREALPPPPSSRQQSFESGEVKDLRQAILTSNGDRTTSVFISDAAISSDRSSIAHSSSRLAKLRESGQIVILDAVRMRSRDEAAGMMSGVRDLAQVLRTVDPVRFGLLACCGVLKVVNADTETASNSIPREQLSHFDFVFAVPEPLTEPRSLRGILLSPTLQAPLNEVITLAKLLARSVFFIHTSRFVHKNIRPENILVFKDTEHTMGRPYLIGFERFRVDSSQSMKFGDGVWERDLYRHPTRQGSQPEKYFVMQHDIYSLGVVLLEIGLRTSFVVPVDSEPCPEPNRLLEISQMLSNKDATRRAKVLKKRLIELALERLPVLMGQLYTEVVLSCLRCVESDSGSFGDRSEFEDKDGIEVGVRYIEKVRFLHCYHSRSARILNLPDSRPPRRNNGLTRDIVRKMQRLSIKVSTYTVFNLGVIRQSEACGELFAQKTPDAACWLLE